MAVTGAKQDQNEEEGGGADVSVDGGVADRNAESVESVSDRQECKRKRSHRQIYCWRGQRKRRQRRWPSHARVCDREQVEHDTRMQMCREFGGWGSLDGCSEVCSCCLTSQHHCREKLAGQGSARMKMVALLLRQVVVRTGQG